LDDVQKRLGLTTLHVTHDPREVERIADRTLTLDTGRATSIPLEVST
jgi:ABC-type sulfate/molybdate transport systems ATPase subunit